MKRHWLLTARWIVPTIVVGVPVLASAAAFGATSSATASRTCASRSIQGSIEAVGATASSGEPIYAGDSVRISARCKSGVGAYVMRVCVRHPGNIVRCRNVGLTDDNFGSFVIKTPSDRRWTYRVSWAPKAGAKVALRLSFRTAFEPS